QPRVRTGVSSRDERLREIDNGHDQPDTQNRCPSRRENIKDLKFLWVCGISPRHSLIAQYKLGKERQVEPNKDKHCGDLAPEFGIHLSGHLRPPVVDPGEVSNYLSANHNVVEVSDYEIRIRKVHI